MSEKELKEMMVSEDTDHDDVEKAIEDLEAEIDRMLKEINEISPEEKVIMEKILKALDEHKLKYSYDKDEPKHVDLRFNMEDKPFEIDIILQNGKVILKLTFPFKVRANAVALMGMYMAEFNSSGTAFSPLDMDFDKGKLYMDYAYMLEEPNQFDEKNFWIYMTSHIKFALEIYIRLENIAVGIVPKGDRKLYKKLLEMALETVSGDFDDDNVSYGTESLKSDSIPDLSDLFGKPVVDEGKDDDSDLDGEDITSDIVRSLRRRRRVPSFEKFMRMKEQAQGSSKEVTKAQPEKASGMLSMFAKRDDEIDPKVVGGNEDE